MTDVSTTPVFAVPAEDTELAVDIGFHETGDVGDDIDFALGGVEEHAEAHLATDDGADEIGYEDDDVVAEAAAAGPGAAEDAYSPSAEVAGTNADETDDVNKDVDEAGYGDIGLSASHDVASGADAEDGVEEVLSQEEFAQEAPEMVSEVAELDIELHGSENVAPLNEGSDMNKPSRDDEAEQDGSVNDDGHVDVPEEEVFDEVEEDNIEEAGADEGDVDVHADADADVDPEREDGLVETDFQMHSQMDHDGGDAADEAYEDVGDDVEDGEKDDDDKHEEYEVGDLGLLDSLSSFDVTVTWGDQVCPLFKAPDVEDPDMFYLEDAEALNYPLSKFLQTIRSSIASWVNSSDEIFIRVEDLGLEFGETTTEALLNQVTFHNLLALHSTLSKNDDPEAQRGVHITLGTRPNCLFRLRDLVTGAGSGKGLSVFQTQTGSETDESYADNGEDEDGSDDLPLDADDDEDDYSPLSENDTGAPAPEDEGGDTEMTGASGGIASGAANPAEAEEESYEDGAEEILADEPAVGAAELDVPLEAEALAVVAEEPDYVPVANEDGVDATHSAPAAAPVSSASNPELELGDETHVVNGLLDEAATGGSHHHDDLDVWGDVGPSGDDSAEQGKTEGYEGTGDLQPASATAPEPQLADPVDDVLLDAASGDAEANGVPEDEAAILPAEELDAAFDSSATATLDHDEIDYEDSQVAVDVSDAQHDSTLDTGADEIDWDDEIKNASSEATTPPLPATGKRSREENESGDALLDDSPDPKRQRAEASSI